MKKNIAILLVIICLAGIAVYQNFNRADAVVLPKEHAPKVDFLAPTFSLEGMDERAYQLTTGTRDKALLINFWASWCGPCEQEAPELVRLYEKYSDKLDIYAVNATKYSDTVEDAKAFAEKYEFQFPVLFDLDGQVSEMYDVYAFPTSFLVNPDGVIEEIIYGFQSAEHLESSVKKLID
ncbi:TlpA family protein disulfide reductase [Marinicrinis lubricantis]|uniref:TlpA family protein disulfide reductase n=1 Tax=Marinicrinis lubricantis TaxID=2086470 RepID=A0ABW1ITF2_9BACL